jgi:hypothetical protein
MEVQMSTMRDYIPDAQSLVLPRFGWMATMTGSWVLAGGAGGGVATAGLLLFGRVHPDALLLTAAFLATLGSLFGAVHGAVLGYLGRPKAASSDSLHPRLTVPLAALFAFTAAMIIAVWLSIAVLAGLAGQPAGWFILLFALPLAIGTLVWATILGWYAIENAYARWPDHRIGSFLILGAFVVLLAAFLAVRPVIPGLRLQLSTPAGTIAAALAALWLAAPAIFFGLRLIHRSR